VPLAHRALFELQHRGREAAASLVRRRRSPACGEGRGLITEAAVPRVDTCPGPRLSLRYRRGLEKNVQPFVANTPYGQLALAHNGNIKNAAELRTHLQAQGSLVATSLDTELLVHLIARSHAPDFAGALRYMADAAIGAYSLTMLCNGTLYALRDPNGLRPLVLGEMKGGWVIASETCALDVLHADYVREIEAGELVTIGPDGVTSSQLLPRSEPSPCIFELVFSPANSTAFGQSVNGARIRMGMESPTPTRPRCATGRHRDPGPGLGSPGCDRVFAAQWGAL
jgi:amidophosphoribosyltransferase